MIQRNKTMTPENRFNETKICFINAYLNVTTTREKAFNRKTFIEFSII